MITFEPDDFYRIQQHLGERRKLGREDGYTVDPFYLRRTSKNTKVFFWDYYTGKWTNVSPGQQFKFDENGVPVKHG